MAKVPRGRWSKTRAVWTLCLSVFAFVSMLLLLLLGIGIIGVPSGSSPSDASISLRLPVSHLKEDESLIRKPWSEAISWEPRASLFHNFLSEEECDHLIRVAMPLMQKSTVVDSETGQSRDSRVRTSSGTFLNRGQDRVIAEIESRIAEYSFIPKEHGEGIQVLHYEPGQKYDAHHDYFYDPVNTKNGGQRIATMLIYLTDVEEGGETVFPNSVQNATSLPWFNELSECGRRGVAVRPRRGDALLFWSMTPDAKLDPRSLHGGCPVVKGDKWSATKWMRVYEYKL